jgi:hypothetical protein
MSDRRINAFSHILLSKSESISHLRNNRDSNCFFLSRWRRRGVETWRGPAIASPRCAAPHPCRGLRPFALPAYITISTAIGNDVRDQSTRSSLVRGTYFSNTILRASVSSSVLVIRRAVPENMLLLIFIWTVGFWRAFFSQSDLSRPPESR